MRFTSVLVAALPFVGSVSAYPFINPASKAAVDAGSRTLSMREINYTAQSEFQLDSSKRDFHHMIRPRDLTDDVSKLLGIIVEDLNSLLSPVEGILSQIPIVGPILEDINTALDAIIQGLDKVLGGILDLVANILKHLGINLTPLLSGLLQLLTCILGGS
ncbi:hypothetical protein C351_03947 [Cryptococcus neoformans c8]|nr:hypothetical protein C353_04069 [Cryptococcus neoformans var. grubii AD1-83a]OXG56600.1 hypothetical protein C354_04003 [Cryptococcus neoformans var. grubii MW-RSA1955]OXG60759.1 hypothetical protein C352_04004 [Cryptococcus neoformans var. grubii CHC193]OXG62044.1 hypothetical protein C351_03947 [Cryptococcus neoformans var. grubii c8]OXH08556.1 hypothetical protein C369_04040 [Cryptococcus neoformans var. grubii A5-35-17]OXH09951.1 hypothetical protein C370_04111 [Cryptococcus neoformans 